MRIYFKENDFSLFFHLTQLLNARKTPFAAQYRVTKYLVSAAFDLRLVTFFYIVNQEGIRGRRKS